MNYNKLWILLKGHIETKNSHGKQELLKVMRDLEIQEVKSSNE